MRYQDILLKIDDYLDKGLKKFKLLREGAQDEKEDALPDIDVEDLEPAVSNQDASSAQITSATSSVRKGKMKKSLTKEENDKIMKKLQKKDKDLSKKIKEDKIFKDNLLAIKEQNKMLDAQTPAKKVVEKPQDVLQSLIKQKMPSFELIRRDIHKPILRIILRASILKESEVEKMEEYLI